MFFHLWEVVQIFQRESIFCNKISSGGSLFIEKLVPGGTNFGGSIFTNDDVHKPKKFDLAHQTVSPRERVGSGDETRRLQLVWVRVN